MSRAPEQAKPTRIRNKEKVQQALDLRKAGCSYAEIARQMQISKSRAHDFVTAGLDELGESIKDTATSVRELELYRLDALILSHWPHRAVWKSAEIILRAQERRAKMLGLDAPTKLAQTTPEGEALPPALDLSKLSDEQLAQLELIYAAAGPVAAESEQHS